MDTFSISALPRTWRHFCHTLKLTRPLDWTEHLNHICKGIRCQFRPTYCIWSNINTGLFGGGLGKVGNVGELDEVDDVDDVDSVDSVHEVDEVDKVVKMDGGWSEWDLIICIQVLHIQKCVDSDLAQLVEQQISWCGVEWVYSLSGAAYSVVNSRLVNLGSYGIYAMAYMVEGRNLLLTQVKGIRPRKQKLR